MIKVEKSFKASAVEKYVDESANRTVIHTKETTRSMRIIEILLAEHTSPSEAERLGHDKTQRLDPQSGMWGPPKDED